MWRPVWSGLCGLSVVSSECDLVVRWPGVSNLFQFSRFMPRISNHSQASGEVCLFNFSCCPWNKWPIFLIDARFIITKVKWHFINKSNPANTTRLNWNALRQWWLKRCGNHAIVCLYPLVQRFTSRVSHLKHHQVILPTFWSHLAIRNREPSNNLKTYVKINCAN